MKLSLFTDGGSRGNPGPAAIGVVIYKGSKIVKTRAYTIGEKTNNMAEYHAVIDGLETCKGLGATEVDCYSDSQLIVRQIAGDWRVMKRHLRRLRDAVMVLKYEFRRVDFHWVPRETPGIQRADELLNEELDKA